MDPRKAATVTAPDLLAAFHQDTQLEVTKDEESPLRVFLSLFTKDDDDPETTEYPLDQLDVALHDLRTHLRKGGSRGGAIVIDHWMPELVSQSGE